MIARLLRSRWSIPVAFVLLALAYWWLHPRPPKVIGIGYINERSAILYDTLAQVRQPVAMLHYGDRVELLRVETAQTSVRTAAGVIGWMDSRQVMEGSLWQKTSNLLQRTRSMPVQARGHTKTVSNIRIEPGRNGPRIYQFIRGTPVYVYAREVADAPSPSEDGGADSKAAPGEDQKPKQEDWLLVMRDVSAADASATAESAATSSLMPSSPVSGAPLSAPPAPALGSAPPIQVAGWVLARFIDLDLPGPVRDYASSADLHPVAWFELNRVPDGSGGEAPQFLVAGTHGGEGLPCDFTMIRVYTWSARRQHYETAYIDNNLCGTLPILVTKSAAGPEFRFAGAGEKNAEHMYIMRQTVVRRVKSAAQSPPARRR